MYLEPRGGEGNLWHLAVVVELYGLLKAALLSHDAVVDARLLRARHLRRNPKGPDGVNLSPEPTRCQLSAMSRPSNLHVG